MTFLIWHLVFFRRVLCFVGFRVIVLTFFDPPKVKNTKKHYVLYEICDIDKAQNPPNTTLAVSFDSWCLARCRPKSDFRFGAGAKR